MGWQRYTVEHETRYTYRVPVAQSWQLAHLTPRVRIEPLPDERREALDSFGNGITHFSLHAAHAGLAVSMHSTVEVGDRPSASVDRAPAWEAVREARPSRPVNGEAVQRAIWVSMR